jgi:hypothetical protein
MVNLNPYLKAVTGALVAGIGPVVTAEVTTHRLDASVWVTAASFFLTALYGVYATTNTPKAAAVPAPVIDSSAAAVLAQAEAIHPTPTVSVTP